MGNVIMPDVLYHYTTQDGLLGILKEKAIWATKIHYLNDASELVAPLNVARDKLVTRALKLANSDDKEQQIILSMQEDIENWEQVNVFVFSFCTEGDVLSQWRAYGAPGSAYSIGFNTKELVKNLNPFQFELHSCEYYGAREQISIIEKYIDDSIEASLQNPGREREFIGKFIKMASKIKHKSFEEEGEWRIVSNSPRAYTDEKFNFRPGISTIVPYYSLPLDPLPIVEIIVGPSPHLDLTKNSIEGLRHKFDLKAIKPGEIRTSQIPYRNW